MLRLPVKLSASAAKSRPNPGNIQSNPIQARLRAQVEGLTVIVPPGKVVRMLWADDRSHVLAFGRDNPKPARTRSVEIPLLVDFHSVERVFAFGGSHIEEHFAIG